MRLDAFRVADRRAYPKLKCRSARGEVERQSLGAVIGTAINQDGRAELPGSWNDRVVALELVPDVMRLLFAFDAKHLLDLP